MRMTLLLDSHYQPLGIINWQKAITLLLQEKAEVLTEGHEIIRTVTRRYNVPRVLRLLKRGYQKYKASFSKRSIYLRDKGICAYCNLKLTPKTLTIDHVLPKCQGGKHTWSNVVTACKPCNNRKAGYTPDQAEMPLMYPPRVPSRMELIKQAIEEYGLQPFLREILGE